MCGLRPRIERKGCTFGRRLCKKCTFPRSYVRSMQPMRNFFALKSKLFCQKFAHMHFLLYLCTLFRVLGSQVALLRGRMMQIFPHANVDDLVSRPADVIIKNIFKQCTQL